MTVSFISRIKIPDFMEFETLNIVNDLIKQHNADSFYIGGGNGNIDIFRNLMKKVKTAYPQIRYSAITSDCFNEKINCCCIVIQDVEYAQCEAMRLNIEKWLIENSDFLIYYLQNKNKEYKISIVKSAQPSKSQLSTLLSQL